MCHYILIFFFNIGLCECHDCFTRHWKFSLLQDFVDIILSKTQRKTPTVIHKHFKISRIRRFYMTKVKYTQQNFHDRLTAILTEFPKLEVSSQKIFKNIFYMIHQARTREHLSY